VLRGIISGATFHHNFALQSSGANTDVGLDQMISNGFLPNVYTAIVEGDDKIDWSESPLLKSETSCKRVRPGGELTTLHHLLGELQYFITVGIEYSAENEIMGYPPFANATSPTLAEALERPSYSCGNIYRVAGGCFPFGDLSFQLNPTWIRNMTLLSAVDTGTYYMTCLSNSTDNESSFHSKIKHTSLSLSSS